MQNGFELADIVREPRDSITIDTAGGAEHVQGGFDGDTVLCVRCLWMPPFPGPNYSTWYGVFQASGLSSTGSKFNLAVNEPDFLNDSASGLDKVDPAFAVVVPGTYPPSYRWIDVTVTSRDGHTATWRLTNLPRTHRAFAEPSRDMSSVVNSDKVRVKYTADVHRDLVWLKFDLSQKPFKAPAGEHWQYLPDYGNCQTEWETVDAEQDRLHPRQVYIVGGTSREISAVSDAAHGTGDVETCPYPENRFVRSFGDLDRIATLDETVTFHGVPVANSRGEGLELDPHGPMTAVTPSGITLRLMPYGTPHELVSMQGAVNVILHVDPGSGTFEYDSAPLVRAANSPLCRKYGKNVQIFVTMPGHRNGESGGDGHLIQLSFMGPLPSGNVMNTVTFVVHQKLIVQKTPVTVVVSVRPARRSSAT